MTPQPDHPLPVAEGEITDTMLQRACDEAERQRLIRNPYNPRSAEQDRLDAERIRAVLEAGSVEADEKKSNTTTSEDSIGSAGVEGER